MVKQRRFLQGSIATWIVFLGISIVTLLFGLIATESWSRSTTLSRIKHAMSESGISFARDMLRLRDNALSELSPSIIEEILGQNNDAEVLAFSDLLGLGESENQDLLKIGAKYFNCSDNGCSELKGSDAKLPGAQNLEYLNASRIFLENLLGKNEQAKYSGHIDINNFVQGQCSKSYSESSFAKNKKLEGKLSQWEKDCKNFGMLPSPIMSLEWDYQLEKYGTGNCCPVGEEKDAQKDFCVTISVSVRLEPTFIGGIPFLQDNSSQKYYLEERIVAYKGNNAEAIFSERIPKDTICEPSLTKKCAPGEEEALAFEGKDGGEGGKYFVKLNKNIFKAQTGGKTLEQIIDEGISVTLPNGTVQTFSDGFDAYKKLAQAQVSIRCNKCGGGSIKNCRILVEPKCNDSCYSDADCQGNRKGCQTCLFQEDDSCVWDLNNIVAADNTSGHPDCPGKADGEVCSNPGGFCFGPIDHSPLAYKTDGQEVSKVFMCDCPNKSSTGLVWDVVGRSSVSGESIPLCSAVIGSGKSINNSECSEEGTFCLADKKNGNTNVKKFKCVKQKNDTCKLDFQAYAPVGTHSICEYTGDTIDHSICSKDGQRCQAPNSKKWDQRHQKERRGIYRCNCDKKGLISISKKGVCGRPPSPKKQDCAWDLNNIVAFNNTSGHPDCPGEADGESCSRQGSFCFGPIDYTPLPYKTNGEKVSKVFMCDCPVESSTGLVWDLFGRSSQKENSCVWDLNNIVAADNTSSHPKCPKEADEKACSTQGDFCLGEIDREPLPYKTNGEKVSKVFMCDCPKKSSTGLVWDPDGRASLTSGTPLCSDLGVGKSINNSECSREGALCLADKKSGDLNVKKFRCVRQRNDACKLDFQAYAPVGTHSICEYSGDTIDHSICSKDGYRCQAPNSKEWDERHQHERRGIYRCNCDGQLGEKTPLCSAIIGKGKSINNSECSKEGSFCLADKKDGNTNIKKFKCVKQRSTSCTLDFQAYALAGSHPICEYSGGTIDDSICTKNGYRCQAARTKSWSADHEYARRGIYRCNCN